MCIRVLAYISKLLGFKGEIILTSLLERPNELLYYMWGDADHIVAQMYTKS